MVRFQDRALPPHLLCHPWSGPLWRALPALSRRRADLDIATLLELEFPTADWFGTPVWTWLIFLGIVLALLALGVIWSLVKTRALTAERADNAQMLP